MGLVAYKALRLGRGKVLMVLWPFYLTVWFTVEKLIQLLKGTIGERLERGDGGGGGR